MKEILVDIKGYKGKYQISNKGNVYSVGRSSFLKQDLVRGYRRVTLCKNGKTERFQVHTLVANAFIPNPENKPIIHHIDHDKSNNCVENLEWVTYYENTKYDKEDGVLGVDSYKLTEDEVRLLRKMKASGNYTNKELSTAFGINERNVRRIYNRETYKEVK